MGQGQGKVRCHMKISLPTITSTNKLPQPMVEETKEIELAISEIATKRFDDPLSLIFELVNLTASSSVMQLHNQKELEKVRKVAGKGAILVE